MVDIQDKPFLGSKFNYLCRQRRFGKSILVDTLACYFEGLKYLLEGLKIMDLKEEWNVYPVVRLDMSEAEATEEWVRRFFNRKFREMEHDNGIPTFEGDRREVVALAIELDDEGKGLLDWRRVE